MLLAELEIRHSRPVAPTRRVALGELYLPADPAPGFGGLLLAAVVGAHVSALDDDELEELGRLLDDLERGGRVPQPRLRHRFQVDTIGLDRSRHRLEGDGESLELDLDDHGSPLPNVLGAAYAASLLSFRARPSVFRLVRRATRWDGQGSDGLLPWLTGDEAAGLRGRGLLGDERWARTVLGFRSDSEPDRAAVNRRFRDLVRSAHPDSGGDADAAGRRMVELTEAKRILLRGVAV